MARMLLDNMYCAVRKSRDGYEWLDTTTLSGLQERSQQKAQEMNKISEWDKANPVVRYARVEVREVTE